MKEKYDLWVTPPEQAAIARVLGDCPDERVPTDSGAATSVTLNIRDPGPPPRRLTQSRAYPIWLQASAMREARAGSLNGLLKSGTSGNTPGV